MRLPLHQKYNEKPINNTKTNNMKLTTFKVLLAAAVVSSGVAAYSFTSNRRSFLVKGGTTVATVASASASLPKSAIAEEPSDPSDPYADYITTESGLRYKVIKEGK